MSHLLVHAAVAVPFAVAGEWAGAAAALAPDATWVPHEWRFRRSGVREWREWVQRDDALLPPVLYAYRIAHSWVLAAAVLLALHLLLPSAHVGAMAMGYYAHLLLDLPTHRGALAQRPFFPFSNWRWPWVIRD